MNTPRRRNPLLLYVLFAGATAGTVAIVSVVLVNAGAIRSERQKPAIDVDAHAAALHDRLQRRAANLHAPPLNELIDLLRHEPRPVTRTTGYQESQLAPDEIVRLIARYGPSEESSRALIDFIDRGSANFTRTLPFDYALDGTLNAVAALGLTGGEEERKLLLALLHDDRSNKTAAAWMSRIERQLGLRSIRKSEMRGSAALGLLLSDDESCHAEVQRLYAEIQDRVSRGEATHEESHLNAAGLPRALQTVDIVERFGDEILFIDRMSVEMGRRLLPPPDRD